MLKNLLILTTTLFLILIPGYSSAQDRTAQDYLNRGVQLSENPDTYNEAFTNLQNAVNLLPKDDSRLRIAYTKLAKIYNYWGRYDGAIKYCNYVFDLAPKYLEARKYFGMAKFHKGSYSEAIKNLKKWSEDQPKDIEAIEYLGLCYMNLKDYKKAMDEFKKIRTEKGKANFRLAQQSYLVEQVRPIYKKGLKYFNKGDWERAIGKFKECLLKAPFYEAAKDKLKQSEQNWIADLEEKLIGDPKNIQLREALKIVVGSKDGAIDFYYDGLIAFKDEHWGKAYRNFERVLEIDPEYEQAKERKDATLNNWIKALQDSLAKEENLGDRNLMFDLNYALSKAGKGTIYVTSYYDGLKFFRSGNWKNAFINLDKVPTTFEDYTQVENIRNLALAKWIEMLKDSLSNDPADLNLITDLETALSKAGEPKDYVVPYYRGLSFYRQENWKNAVLRFDQVPTSFEGYRELNEMYNNALLKWKGELLDTLSKNPYLVSLKADLKLVLKKLGEDNSFVDPFYNGLAFFKSRLWKDALENFDKIPKSYKNSISILHLQTSAMSNLLYEYLRALEKESSNVSYKLRLEDLIQKYGLIRLNKLVIDSCKTRYLFDPDNHQKLMNLAIAFLMIEDYDSAYRQFDRALQKNFNYKEYDKTFIIKISKILTPESKYYLFYRLGVLLFERGAFQNSLNILTKIPKDSDYYFDTLWYKAISYSLNKNSDLARKIITQLIIERDTSYIDEKMAKHKHIETKVQVLCDIGVVGKRSGFMDWGETYLSRAIACAMTDTISWKYVTSIVTFVNEHDQGILDSLKTIISMLDSSQSVDDLDVKISIMRMYLSKYDLLVSQINHSLLRKTLEENQKIIGFKEFVKRNEDIPDLYVGADILLSTENYIGAIILYQRILAKAPSEKEAMYKLIDAEKKWYLQRISGRRRENLRTATFWLFGIAVGFLLGVFFYKFRSS